MTNGKNDVEELEELLTELEGQGALPVGSYSEEDDAPTQQMEAPVGDQEWMVQLAPLDRRMMSGDQVRAELASGTSIDRETLVWRGGMSDWTPISRVDELAIAARGVKGAPPSAPFSERRPAPLPPVPIPPRVGASSLSAPLPPVPLRPVPLPPVPVPPSSALGLPRPTPPVALPALHSAFNASPVPPSPVSPSPVPQSAPNPAFQVPPAAAAPSPAPPVFGASRNNTTRPVAVDFGEMAPSPPARPLRTVLASGVAALLTVIVTVYSLSRGGVFEPGVQVSAESEVSSPRAAAPAPPTSEPAAAPAATPAPSAPSEPQAAEAPAAEAKAESAAPAAAESAAPVQAEAKAQPSSSDRRPSTREPRQAASVADDSAESKPLVVPASTPATSEPAVPTEKEAASKDSAPVRMARMLEARRKARTSAAAGDAEGAEAAPAPAKPRRSPAKASAADGEGAAVSAASDVDSDETPKDADKPGSTFDRSAAKIALDGAANQAKNCRPQGGPSGPGRVQVRYEPSGKVGSVSILTPKFDNTTAGSCVMMVFKRASIPAFSGAPSVVLTKSFEIP